MATFNSPAPIVVADEIANLREGKQASLAGLRLGAHCYERLVRWLARRVPLRGKVSESDVANSTLCVVLTKIRQGAYPDLTDADDLWKLLFTVAYRKALKKRR